MRSVLIGPFPGRTFPDTFQLPPVSPGFLHRLALEGDHSFIEGEITLESYQLILRIDGRRGHGRDEVAPGSIDGHFRKRDRRYRSSNLVASAASCDGPLRTVRQKEKRRRRRSAYRNSDRSGRS